MLTLPNGKVLPNWVFLSFSEKVRENFYLMDLSFDSMGEFLPKAKSYFQALQEHMASHPNGSYRDISNFNALLAIEAPHGRRYEQRVKHYVDLCEKIEKIDHKMMGDPVW